MHSWFFIALLALVNFGLWGFFSKLAIDHVDVKSAFFYQTIGAAVVGLLGLYLTGLKPVVEPRGVVYGLLTGGAYSLGCLLYFVAIQRGSVNTVVTMTALYPLVTILLSVLFLHEVINLRQTLGVLCAIVAMFLFVG